MRHTWHTHWPHDTLAILKHLGDPCAGAEERERAGGEDFVSQLQGARVAGARWRPVGCWGNPRMVGYGSV